MRRFYSLLYISFDLYYDLLAVRQIELAGWGAAVAQTILH